MIRLNTFIKMNMLQVICAVFILTFGSFCTGESGICQPFEMKSKYLNKQLVGHSVSESIGLGLKECVEGCMSLSVCKSTDYYMPGKTCKLNDVDSSSVDISEFRSLNGAVFSDISEWPEMMVGSCSSRPCTKSQRCYDDMGNFHCVDLTCKKPSIANGKLMLSAPNNKKFLDTATVECRAGYIPDIPSVKCQASGTWEQATCIDINECSSDPCQNGGSCVDAINMYTCTCAPGYTGNDCETDINECSSDPCQNGGSCVDAINMYTCTCAPGYTGKDCETDINECSSDPCQNGGSCVDAMNMYTCTCAPGYTGKDCETDINECSSDPCQNGGSCVDAMNMYTCTCAPGYTGKDCETDINECSSDPCQNGGSCVDAMNIYTCTCAPGYTGKDCETDINECSSDPCQNGGSCVDAMNMYTCTCAPGYTGKDCETAIASDCYDVYYKNISKKSGVYDVTLWKSKKTIQVYCDMDTFPYGWTVFQKRFNGSVDFYQNFSQYTDGFGSVYGELWLGLRYVEEMASQYESDLRVDLTAADNSHVYEQFEEFSLSRYPAFTLHLGRQTVDIISGLRYVEEMASQYESDFRLDLTAADNSHVYEQFGNFNLSTYPKFTLNLGRYTEQISSLRYVEEMASQYESDFRLDLTAADNSHVYEQFGNFNLSTYPKFTLNLGRYTEQISSSTYGFSYSKGVDFSTFDHDAEHDSRNCAELQRGGWWYVNCSRVNLNGLYISPPGTTSSVYSGWGGFIYYPWKGYSTLKTSKIMFRKHSSD